ncbi:MAG: hypothetical protein K8F58_05440, partial [Bauldia sp.]|nr:hypothetical protein [Bauldia sp.]
AFRVIAARAGACRAPVARGMVPRRKRREPHMANNLDLAGQVALDLARTLMICVTLFKSELGYGVVPSDEFDGDPATVIHIYDPYAA